MSDQIKIRGRGDTRTVWNGSTQIGEIHRHERETVTARINGTTVTFRAVTAVYWSATRMDGSPIRHGNGEQVYLSTMKAWARTPWMFTGRSKP